MVPRSIFRGDCGDARREECAPGSPRARILSFGVKPLPPGIASAQALSCRFSFPRHRFIPAGDEESDPRSAWAPQLSFILLLNLWGVIATPFPSFLRFPVPLPYSAPSKVKARCVLCPSSTVRPTGSIAEGRETADPHLQFLHSTSPPLPAVLCRLPDPAFLRSAVG